MCGYIYMYRLYKDGAHNGELYIYIHIYGAQ